MSRAGDGAKSDVSPETAEGMFPFVIEPVSADCSDYLAGGCAHGWQVLTTISMMISSIPHLLHQSYEARDLT